MPAQKTKRVAPKQASYFEESVDLSNNYAAYPQDLLIDEDVETLRKPPPSIEEEEESNLVHFLGLVANLILVLGFASYQSFAVLEFDGRDRGTPANATYVTAFTCFFTSAMIELVIDVVLKRTFAHGRYTNKKGWNVVISTLFIVGTTLDITAFFLWNQRKFTQEHRVLYAAGHFWLVTAILVLWAEGSRMIAQMKKCGSDGLDGVGNLLFLVGALMDCIVRYMDIPGTPRTERPLAKLEFSSSPIWLASAVFYVIADLLRSKKRRRTQTTQNLRTFEEKYENRCGWTGRYVCSAFGCCFTCTFFLIHYAYLSLYSSAFVGVLTIGALSCSLLCALSCDFIAFESITGVPDDELEKWPPYDGNVLGAEIGIFSYRITESKNDQQNMETCEAFSDLWKGFEDNGGTTLWVVAQFCAVFAVVFGVLGGLTNLMDCCCRPSRGCFPTYWIPVGFSFLAFGSQSCTFLMLMDTGFWYVSKTDAFRLNLLRSLYSPPL